jgi:hypothetical protein
VSDQERCGGRPGSPRPVDRGPGPDSIGRLPWGLCPGCIDCQPEQGQDVKRWPDGQDRKRVLYFCPKCEVECRSPWHTCDRGPSLVPQMAEETECVEVEVIPADSPNVLSEEEAREVARYLQGSGRTDIQKLWCRLSDYAEGKT